MCGKELVHWVPDVKDKSKPGDGSLSPTSVAVELPSLNYPVLRFASCYKLVDSQVWFDFEFGFQVGEYGYVKPPPRSKVRFEIR